jgi:hypothetical protein
LAKIKNVGKRKKRGKNKKRKKRFLHLCFTLIDAFHEAFEQSSSCLISIGPSPAFTSAVYKHGESLLEVLIHSRNSAGICSANGKAILLEFTSLADLVSVC